MRYWEELEALTGYRGGASTQRPGETGRPAKSPPWGRGAQGRVQRLSAATGAAQAVVKVIGYRGGRPAASRALAYLARERDPLEGGDGLLVATERERADLLDAWGLHGLAEPSKHRRDVMHVAISFPIGTDRALAAEVVRAALPDMVGARDWVISVHRDTAHPHVHALVRMRDLNGRMLRTDRAVLRHWRELIAERGRERGLALEASPRWARGRGLKGERGWERAMIERGEAPRTYQAAAREVADRLERGAPAEGAFESLIQATGARERAELSELGWALLGEARANVGQRRDQLLRFARLIGEAARDLPHPQSRRDVMAAIWREQRKHMDRPDPDDVARAFVAFRQKGRARSLPRDRNPIADAARDREHDRDPATQNHPARTGSNPIDRASHPEPKAAQPRDRERDGPRD